MAGDMAQWVMLVFPTYDLNSIPRTHLNELLWWPRLVLPVLGCWDKGHLASLARQLRLLDSLKVRESPCVRKKWWCFKKHV